MCGQPHARPTGILTFQPSFYVNCWQSISKGYSLVNVLLCTLIAIVLSEKILNL